ncbi:MAG: GNAT family N-acetyltransferase [Clostridia bacterium]|jgi:spore coat polysaccharide biosynthesis protein SpsF
MEKVYLKKVDCKDIDLLFEWSNDGDVRVNSFNQNDIEYSEHIRWFRNCIQNENVDIYICYLNVEPVGQIRLEYSDETANISYSIAKEHRNKGVGEAMINLTEVELISSHPNVTFLTGSVKLSNIASQKVFEKCGYDKKLMNDENEYFKYFKRVNLLSDI